MRKVLFASLLLLMILPALAQAQSCDWLLDDTNTTCLDQSNERTHNYWINQTVCANTTFYNFTDQSCQFGCEADECRQGQRLVSRNPIVLVIAVAFLLVCVAFALDDTDIVSKAIIFLIIIALISVILGIYVV